MTVESLDRATAWWEEMFGATTVLRTHFDAVDADVAIVKGPGVTLELLQVADQVRLPELQAEPPAHLRPIGAKTIVLETDDVSALVDELEAKGVTIVWRDLEAGELGPMSAIRDSEGNLITIFPRSAA